MAGLVCTKIETRESSAREHRHANTFRTASASFGPRDKPNPNAGKNETNHMASPGNAFRKSGYKRRNRSAKNRGNRRDQPHISAPQCPIEKNQRQPSKRPGEQRPPEADNPRK